MGYSTEKSRMPISLAFSIRNRKSDCILFWRMHWALLAKHLELPDDIDVEFRGDPDQRRPSLHGRLAFIFHSEGDREQHFCFRILVHSNAIAFQSRLNAAMVASGVDRALSFRHLFILRPDEPPSGPKTRQLVQKFVQAGGRFIVPTEGDLRAFVALRNMLKRELAGFDVWLRKRKPLFSTALFKSADLCPPGFLPAPKPDRGQSAPLDAPLGSAEQPRTQRQFPSGGVMNAAISVARRRYQPIC